jgi:hypothetical protein
MNDWSQEHPRSDAVGRLQKLGWEQALPNAMWTMLATICAAYERGRALPDDWSSIYDRVPRAPDEHPGTEAWARPLFQAGRWPPTQPRRGDPDLRRDTFRSVLSLDETNPLDTLHDGLEWLEENELVNVDGLITPTTRTTLHVLDVFTVEPPIQNELYAWLQTSAGQDLALLDYTSNELTHEALVDVLATGALHGLWLPSTPAMRVSAAWPFHLHPPAGRTPGSNR